MRIVANCWAIGRSSLEATKARLIRMALCEGRRLCLALILERFEDRFLLVEVPFDEGACFFVPVLPLADGVDFAVLTEVPDEVSAA